MAKDYQRAAPINGKPILAFIKPDVISEEYRALNAQLHAENIAYGVGGGKHADVVRNMATSIKATSILDYGCGKGYLAKALAFPIWEYDPAIPEKAMEPRPADFVVCTDVLEHIEPSKLDAVLGDLQRCVQQVGYFVIHTKAAKKTYANGKNTHLIQKNRAWWEKALRTKFQIGKVFEIGPALHIVVGPKVVGKKTKSSVSVQACGLQMLEAR